MPRQILVVDDAELNRRLLANMLGNEYDVIEAADGGQALEIIERERENLSAVLLDLMMPVMDGYTVLGRMQADAELKQIPVIVMTGNTEPDAEIKALSLGANDYIAKPYAPAIIRTRLRNTINLRETAATVNALQRDRLTGLYNRETFFQKAAERIEARPEGYYVMACFNIDNFKVINDQYGTVKGDEVLKHVARVFSECFEQAGGFVSRIAADNFAVLYPAEFMNSQALIDIRKKASELDGSISPITFSIGRYLIDDKSLSVSAMYDRAMIAETSVKGRYDDNIALYNESMRKRILREQEIVNDMREALESRQFEVWLQPQYNHSSGALIGAEALARWRHPANGLISPGEFIPIFEKNGFIYELDKYVWEESCALIRRWMDEGREPLPISVNMSRYDIYRADLTDTVVALIKKYDIPIDMLRLEITESAFATSTDQIITVVKKLIDYGFTLEIDDFGSGYSSLNTLKDVPAQIVKLDMRFLEGKGDTNRGGNILESIVRMAKWLDMSVIAEGVETMPQADYLKSIGCNYVQGYLYAKPMPTKDYESLAEEARKEQKLRSMETVENLNNNAFWKPESMDTLIFNSYVGGACIFEYLNGNIELLRATDKYAQVIGSAGMTVEDALRLDWKEHLDEENNARVAGAIRTSIETKDEVTCEFVFNNLPGCPEKTYLRSTLRVIAAAGERYMIYCTNENITAQREAERNQREADERLEAIMSNMSCGVTAAVTSGEQVEYLFTNDKFFGILGYTKAQYAAEVKNVFDLFHPEDRERVLAALKNMRLTGDPVSMDSRVFRRDGKMIWEHLQITLIKFNNIDTLVELCVINDVTEQKLAEETIRASAEQLKFLNDTAGDLLASANPTAGLDTVLKKALAHFGATRSYIYEYHAHNNTCENSYEVYAPGEWSDAPRGVFSLDRARHWLDNFERSDFLRYDENDSETNVKYGEFGARRILAVALRAGGELIGAMGVDNPSRHLDDYSNLKALGDYMAVILTRRDMTARMERDRQNLQTLMNDTPGGFARLRVHSDGAFIIEYANDTFARMMGVADADRQALDQRDVSETIHPDDRQLVRATVKEMMETGETRNVQYRLKRKDGEYMKVNVFARMSISEAGGAYINAYYTDMTEREKQALSVRETIPFVLSAIMKSSKDSVYAKDRDFRYLCVSPKFLELCGRNDEKEVIGKTDFELFPRDVAENYRQSDLRLIKSGKALIDEIVATPNQDGATHYTNVSKYILRDTTGEIIGLYGSGRDVTQERSALDQLTLLTNTLPGGIASYLHSNDEVRLTYFSDGYARIFGLTPEEYTQIGSGAVQKNAIKEDVPALRQNVENMVKTGHPMDFTCRVRSKDGALKWINIKAAVAERYGDNVKVNAVLFDVTERMTSQEAARVHEEELRLAMAQMGKLICEYDITTGTLTLPDGFQKQYGRADAVVKGVPESVVAAGIIDPECLSAYMEFYDAIRRGDNVGRAEYRERRKDGRWHWLRVEFSSIFGADGTPAKAIISLEDTTRQHMLYELERKRPMLGEENLIGRALFNLSKGGEVIEYLDKYGQPIPPDRRLTVFGERMPLHNWIPDRTEREKFIELHDADELVRQFEAGVTEHSLEYRRRLARGGVIWVRNVIRVMRQPGGSDIMMFEYCYSIEEERTLALINEKLIRNHYDYILCVDGSSGTYKMLGDAGMSGEDYEEAVKLLLAGTHPEDRDATLRGASLDGMRINLSCAPLHSFTSREIQPDGSVRHKKYTEYYLDKERDIMILAREDITLPMREEIRKSEQLKVALDALNEESRLKEREAVTQLRAIMNNVNGGVFAATVNGDDINYLYVNDEYYSLFGYTKEQFEAELERGILGITHPDDLPKLHEAVRQGELNGKAQFDFRVTRRDGKMMWVRCNSSTCEVMGINAKVHIAVLVDATKEREMADDLRMREELFRMAASMGNRTISRYDIKTGVYTHNEAPLFAIGFTEQISNMPAALIESGIIAPECVNEYMSFYERIRSGAKQCASEIAILTSEHTHTWVRCEATVVFDEQGAPSQAILVMSDITEQREKEAVYRKWQQSLEQKRKDDYTLYRVNLSKDAAFERMSGTLIDYTFSDGDDSFNSRTFAYAESRLHPDDREDFKVLLSTDALLTDYLGGLRQRTLDYRELRAEGAWRWLRVTVDLVEYPYSNDVEAYLMFEDIDEGKRSEIRNKELAQIDPLTGALNRAAFKQAVEKLIDEPGAHSFALMMLDIDGFKLINDTFGHAVGDQVLIDTVKSVRGVLRQSDLLGRFGGDEFLICLPGMPGREAIAKKAAQICGILHKALSEEVYSSASMGIAIYPYDGEDYDALSGKADAALYSVKEHGKNNFAFYEETMLAMYTHMAAPREIDDQSLTDARQRRLLIVDDNDISIKMLSKVFEHEFTIVTAKDGAQALSCIRRFGASIAAVLLDLVMPGMDGFQVLEKMRASVEMRTIPVIVVSSMDEQQTSMTTLRCGAADFVTKPVNPELLRMRVQSVIAKAENDKLRAHNCLLLMRDTEAAKYRMALMSARAAVAEYQHASGVFYYDASMQSIIAGKFDERALWTILIEDLVSSEEDANKLRKLITGAGSEAAGYEAETYITLNTPAGRARRFRASVRLREGAGDFPDRTQITFTQADT